MQSRPIFYFDSNVYARMTDEDVASASRWLGEHRGQLRASETLMSETFRILDAVERRRRFATITAVATDYPLPGAFLSVRELVDAAQRLRPSWLRKRVDTTWVSDFLNLDRNTWRMLRADPGYQPEGVDESALNLAAMVGEVRAGQRRTRSRLRGEKRLPLEALRADDSERQWRVTTAVQFVDGLFGDRRSRLSLSYFDPRQISPPDLSAFFQDDVTDDDLPRHRVMGLADYFQRRYDVTSGNWMDQGHATELLDADFLMTRDAVFYRVLVDIRLIAPIRGTPILVDSSQSLADQLNFLAAASRQAP